MKKIRQFSAYFSMLMVIPFLVSSCASSTNIYTNPKGATVYINNMKVGKTPYTMTDTKIIGTKTNVTLKKEGYEDLNVVIVRNEELDVGALIGGLFVLVPFLWIQKYQEAHSYDLIPLVDMPAMDGPKMKRRPVPSSTVPTSKAARLKELKDLLEQGLITKEDYEKGKAKILGEN